MLNSTTNSGFFAKQVLSSRTELLYLVQGKNQNNPAWHYIQVDKSKLILFKNELKSGNINLAGYGKVLYSGWGDEPPASITEQLKKQFNA